MKKKYVDAEIDSVAGFHIDNEAPDLMVTVDSLHTHFVDYSVCAKDSTKEFILINTGTSILQSYDRVLSATKQDDGSWTPRAYIISLPYDYDYTEYNDANQAKVYRLRFKEGRTSRYFDLQGRPLNGKVGKGLFIENGKKIINR